MLIAQLSDLHVRADGTPLVRRFDTLAALDGAIDHVLALQPQPDVVLATGDLADDGLPADYARLAAAFARLPMPVYVIPGNHDRHEPFHTAFVQHGYLPKSASGYLCYAVDDHPVRLVGVDTVQPGDHHGRLCSHRREWLAQTLAAAPDRPTLIFMHHPPFASGIPFMDAMGLVNGADVAAIVARHPQVQLVVCGHVHRSVQTRWAGTIGVIAPSTVYQMGLVMEADGMPAYSTAPPAIALHYWPDGGTPLTYTHLIGDWERPRPFREAKDR